MLAACIALLLAQCIWYCHCLSSAGGSLSSCFSDVAVLDTETKQWLTPRIVGAKGVSPRAGHSGAIVGSAWYIVGGGNTVKGEHRAVIDRFVVCGPVGQVPATNSYAVAWSLHHQLHCLFDILVRLCCQSLTSPISGQAQTPSQHQHLLLNVVYVCLTSTASQSYTFPLMRDVLHVLAGCPDLLALDLSALPSGGL
jgi:hypothetical protein